MRASLFAQIASLMTGPFEIDVATAVAPGMLSGGARALFAAATAGGHLAALGLLALAAPPTIDAVLDSPSLVIDLSAPSVPVHTPAAAPAAPSPVPAARQAPARPVRQAVASPAALADPAPNATQSATPALPDEPDAAAARPAAASSSAAGRPSEAPAAALSPARFDAAYLNNPKPVYPPYARRLGEQGKVLLRVSVNAQGLPEAVELDASSGSPRLDAAALESVRRWRFVPAHRGGLAVHSWVTVPVIFNLEG